MINSTFAVTIDLIDLDTSDLYDIDVRLWDDYKKFCKKNRLTINFNQKIRSYPLRNKLVRYLVID